MISEEDVSLYVKQNWSQCLQLIPWEQFASSYENLECLVQDAHLHRDNPWNAAEFLRGPSFPKKRQILSFKTHANLLMAKNTFNPTAVVMRGTKKFSTHNNQNEAQMHLIWHAKTQFGPKIMRNAPESTIFVKEAWNNQICMSWPWHKMSTLWVQRFAVYLNKITKKLWGLG